MIFQDDELDSLLRDMHQQWRRARAVRGAGRSVVLACILLLVACLLDYWLRPSFAFRMLITLSIYGTVLAHVWHTWLRHCLQPFSARRTAWRVENTYPTLNEKLVSAVELEEPAPNVSIVLVDWLRVDAQFDLASLNPMRTFPLRWHSLRVAATLILGIALGMVLSPTRLGRSVPRVLFPAASDATAGPFTLNIISPGDGIFHEGSRVSFVVHASDPSINGVELHIAQEQTHVHPMRSSANTGHHSFLLQDLRSPFRYWAQAGSVRSPVYQVDVAKRPRVEGYQLAYTFPDYTGQPAVAAASDSGNITAMVGTLVTLQVNCSQPLRRLDCVYDGHTLRGALSRGGRRASVQLTVGRSGDFAIRLTDLAGRTNRAIATVHALPDKPPSVHIQSPPADVSANADDAINFAWSARDDFAVVSQRLIVTINGREFDTPESLTEVRDSLVFDLIPLALRPGDLVAVTIEVGDGAGQITRSAPRYIQIGSARHLRPGLPFLQAMRALRSSLDAAAEALPNIRISLDHIRSMETASQVDREHHLATLAQRHAQLNETLAAATQAALQLRGIDLFSRASATAALLYAVLDEQRLFRVPELGQGHDAGNVASIETVLQQTARLANFLETRAHLHIARYTLPLLANRLRNLPDDPLQARQVYERAQRLAESANLAFDADSADLRALQVSAHRALNDFRAIDELSAPLLAQYRGTDTMLNALAERLSLQPAAWARVVALADEFRARGKASEHDELFAGVLTDAAKLRRPGSIQALARRISLFERHQAILILSRDIDQLAEFASTRIGKPVSRALALECLQLRERPLPLARLSQIEDARVRALADGITKAARQIERGKAGDKHALATLQGMRKSASALLADSRQRVQRSRRELLRYTEPPSVALRPHARQIRAVATRLATQPSLRQRHEAKAELSTIVTSLDRLAGDLSEATVNDLRDPNAYLLLGSDRLALALRLRQNTEILKESGEALDSAPGVSADRLRAVADRLDGIADSAAEFERGESGQLSAPDSQTAGIAMRQPVAQELGFILPMAALQRERRALERFAERIDNERPAEPIRSLARRVATLLSADGQASLLATCGDTVLHAHDATSSLLNIFRRLRIDGDFSTRRRSEIDNALALLDDATQDATHVLALFDLPYRALLPQVRDIRDRYRKAARDEFIGALVDVIHGCKRLQRQLSHSAAALPARRLAFAEIASVSANVDPEAITVPLVALDDLIDDEDADRVARMIIRTAEAAEILAESPTSIAEYAAVIAQRLTDNLQFAEFASAAQNIDALWRSVPALANTHHLGYQRAPADDLASPIIPNWSKLPPQARLAVCLAFAQEQVTAALAEAVAVRNFLGAATHTNGPARAAFLNAAELIELAALSTVPVAFAQPPAEEETEEGYRLWPRDAFQGAAIAHALGNEVALYHAKRQDFAAAAEAMEALAVVHVDPLPSQFAERGADWFHAAESALAEFAFRGAPPEGLPIAAALLLEDLADLRYENVVTAYLAGEAQDAIYARDFLAAAAAMDAIAASPVEIARFAATAAEALRLAQRSAYGALSPVAVTGLRLLDGEFPQVEAALRYGNLQLAAVLARRHELPMVAAIFESENSAVKRPARAAGVLERGFTSLGDAPVQELPTAVREAIGRAVLALAGAGGVLADPRGSRPRARSELEAGARHLLLARELLARDILGTLLVRPKPELEDANAMANFDDQLAPVVHGLDRPATKELDEAAADAHDTMGRHVDYPLFFRRANRRYLERLAAESRKWQAR